MSVRARKPSQEKEVAKLRAELDDLKASSKSAEVADIAAGNNSSHEFDQLSPTEQSAATLGVNPASFKPIGWLNNQHYNQLIKSNLLDDDLARRIEAYRTVASS